MFRRVIWIVLDSVGIGEMPDAAAYGDAGSDTLGNLARLRPMRLPNLCRLGLGNIKPLAGLPPDPAPGAAFGRCTLASPGKDTTTGHWEMAGIHLAKPFPLFPNGFPPEIMGEFEKRIGRSAIGNRAASGTEIIKELGAEHMRTGSPIVYTSADSVFQVAAHEQVIPVLELYRICEIAREILRGPYEVGRVIARPFIGAPDLAILTADHGCDPTTPSTDHSREYVPLLVFGPQAKHGVPLGLRATLSDLGQTVAENFGCHLEKGTSFLPAIV